MDAPAGMLSFRPVTLFDAPVLAALHAEIFTASWDPAWDVVSFATTLAMPGATGLIALWNGAGRGSQGQDLPEPAGFVLGHTVLDELEILLIGIRPACRRSGIAGHLLDHFTVAAQRAGIGRVFLEVATGNPAACAFYAKNGFGQIGLRRGYYRNRDGAAMDAAVMSRDISTLMEPVLP